MRNQHRGSVLKYENGFIGDVEKDEMSVDVAHCTTIPFPHYAVPGRAESCVHERFYFYVRIVLLLANSSCIDDSFYCRFRKRSAMKARVCSFISLYISYCPISIPAMFKFYM